MPRIIITVLLYPVLGILLHIRIYRIVYIGGLGFEFCVFIIGWRHAFRSDYYYYYYHYYHYYMMLLYIAPGTSAGTLVIWHPPPKIDLSWMCSSSSSLVAFYHTFILPGIPKQILQF